MTPKVTARAAHNTDTRHAANYEPTFDPDEILTTEAAIKNAKIVDIHRVAAEKNQPRKQFDEEELQVLASNMREYAHEQRGLNGTGVLLPILVHYPPGVSDAKGNVTPETQLIITAGERRFRAAQIAGLKLIPVIISNKTKAEALEDALVENIMRQDLKPHEEAVAFQYLINKYKLSYRGLAKKLYGDAKYVYLVQKRIDLLNLPPELLEVIDERPDTIESARRIKTVEDRKEQQRLIQRLREGATSKIIAAAVRNYHEKHPKKTSESESTVGRSSTATVILPQFDLTLALDSAKSQSEAVARELRGGVSTPDPLKNKLKARIKAVRKALNEVEGLLR